MFLYNENVLAENIVINGEDTGYIICSSGDIIGKRFHKPLSTSICKGGYHQVKLCTNQGEKEYLVHRLVATAFIPNPLNKKEVNHKDGNKNHNYLSNLEWVTREENIQHAFRLGLKKGICGENHPLSKCTNETVHQICEYLEENIKTLQEISSLCNVSVDIVRGILRKKTWTHISEFYNIDCYCVDGRLMYYTFEQLSLVCHLLEENELTRKEISKETGVKITTVNNILRKRSYTNISSNYKINNYTIDKNIGRSIELYSDFDKIKDMINDGYSNKDIIKSLGLPDSRAFRLKLGYFRKYIKNHY